MIAGAKKHWQAENLSFEAANAYHLPYADNCYDVVIISNALHIMKEPEKALKEIRRVLKKDP